MPRPSRLPNTDPDATIHIQVWHQGDTGDLGIATSGRLQLTPLQVIKTMEYALNVLKAQHPEAVTDDVVP